MSRNLVHRSPLRALAGSSPWGAAAGFAAAVLATGWFARRPYF